jgi:nicotinamidase/pyrazinamidase
VKGILLDIQSSLRNMNFNISTLSPEFARVVIVDPQKDFTIQHGGSLGGPGTEAGSGYIERVIEATTFLKSCGFTILATQDWHPSNHLSFASQHPNKKPFDTIMLIRTLLNMEEQFEQVLWPDHCVQGSEGAEFFITEGLIDFSFPKGTHKNFDSYSGIKDDGGIKTELHSHLKSLEKVAALIIYGLATDYCVYATVMDAVDMGFDIILINDLISAVHPEGGEKAIELMKATGKVVVCDSIL